MAETRSAVAALHPHPVRVTAYLDLDGLGLGSLVLRWTVAVQPPEVLPDIGLAVALSPATVLATLALGVLADAVTPLFTIRRLRRMDIPATLRVVEWSGSRGTRAPDRDVRTPRPGTFRPRQRGPAVVR